jgi:SHS2 domain-containing protein
VYRWVEHTGELELWVEDRSVEAVFEEALVALGELMARAEGPGGEPAKREVATSAPDRAALLAEWLNELIYLAETDGFVPERSERMTIAGSTLSATIAGRLGDPTPLVKAATYHGLELREEAGQYSAKVVLDV